MRVQVDDAAELAQLGPAFVRADDDAAGHAVFHVTADADEIVAALGRLHLRSVLVEEPSLEDIFRG